MIKLAKRHSTLNKHANLIILGGLTTFINLFIWACALFIARDVTIPNYTIIFSLVQPLTVVLGYLSSYIILENFKEQYHLKYGLCCIGILFIIACIPILFSTYKMIYMLTTTLIILTYMANILLGFYLIPIAKEKL